MNGFAMERMDVAKGARHHFMYEIKKKQQIADCIRWQKL